MKINLQKKVIHDFFLRSLTFKTSTTWVQGFFYKCLSVSMAKFKCGWYLLCKHTWTMLFYENDYENKLFGNMNTFKCK